jgi:hypothetical protein
VSYFVAVNLAYIPVLLISPAVYLSIYYSIAAFLGRCEFVCLRVSCCEYRIREFKIPTTNNGYGVRLKACFRIALTEADKIYISPEHTFYRSDLGYSVKITFLCCKTESRT